MNRIADYASILKREHSRPLAGSHPGDPALNSLLVHVAFADGQEPGLQGTEMWLSVIHLAAKLLKREDAFHYVPKGVHRTQAVGLGL